MIDLKMINKFAAQQLLGVGREKEGKGAKGPRDQGAKGPRGQGAKGPRPRAVTLGVKSVEVHTTAKDTHRPTKKTYPTTREKQKKTEEKKNCRSNLNKETRRTRANGDGISDVRASGRKIQTSILRVRRIPVGHDLRTGHPSALQSGQSPPALGVPAEVSALSPHLCQICVDS